MDPGGLYNDPKVSVGYFGPTIRLMIATRSLLEFFFGWYYSFLSMCYLTPTDKMKRQRQG